MSNNIVTSKFSGWDELQKKLQDELPKDAKAMLRAALKAGGQVMQEGMVDEAPKDTGFMSEHFNIKTKLISNELAGSAFVGPDGKITYPQKLPKDMAGPQREHARSGRSWPVAVIARFVEFGTVRNGGKGNAFMTRAFEKAKGKALDAIIAKLKKGLGFS